MRKGVSRLQDNLDQLAAAMNGHQITDDTGAIADETTSVEDTASLETNTVDDTATAEKSAEATETAPKAEDGDSENTLAEDETGKRYVPESRFKEVYGKLKNLERAQSAAQKTPTLEATFPASTSSAPQTVDKTEALETEMLFATMPSFNPDSKEYSQELDALGATIYKAAGTTDAKGNFKPGITKLQAARQAVAQARKFTENQIAIAQEARQVKASQADQGITTRVISKGAGTPDPNNMSLEEKEKWLKENGQW